MRIDLLSNTRYKFGLNLVENGKLNNCDYRTFKKYHKIKDKQVFWASRNAMYQNDLQVKIEEIVKNKPKVRAARVFSKLKYENELQNNDTKANYSERAIRRRVKKAKARYSQVAKIPILINHQYGEEIQVDWKESLKIKSKDGAYFHFNVLGMASPYSQKTTLMVTKTRKQHELLWALATGMEKFNGAPTLLKFDNMKTTVDYTKSSRQNKVYNNKIIQFGNDYNIRITTTEPYNPQGKGTIEAKMKFLNNMELYDGKISSYQDIENIITHTESEINEKVSRSEEFGTLPREIIRNNYLEKRIMLKVAKTSTIKVENKHFSVDPKYIGASFWVKNGSNEVQIYDLYGNLLRSHKKSNIVNNYYEKDFSQIMQQSKYARYKKEGQSMDDFIANQYKKLGAI